MLSRQMELEQSFNDVDYFFECDERVDRNFVLPFAVQEKDEASEVQAEVEHPETVVCKV